MNVWLIEDDALFRSTVAAVIDAADGMTCSGQFRSFEEALEAGAADASAWPQVLLLDIGLPGMSGVEGIAHVREASPGTEIVILTVHEDSDKIFEAIRSGASGYVLKPSNAAGLEHAVRAAHRGESPITPRIARRVLEQFAGAKKMQASDAGGYRLSAREQEVLQLMVDGRTKKEMAGVLHLSIHTIDQHVRNVYSKLEVHSRGRAVAKAVGERLVKKT